MAMLATACVLLCVFQLRLVNGDCGVPVGNEGRIIGGNDVGEYRYPWYAALHRPNSPSSIMCGGTLIASRYVLTGAHCFSTMEGMADEKKYKVSLGVYNLCQTESTRREFSVSRVLKHPKFTGVEDYFDIAIMELSTSASSFTPACLPDMNTGRAITTLNDQYGLIAGFGTTHAQDSKSSSCVMRQARIMVYTPQQCLDTKLPLKDRTEASLVCAGLPNGGKDTCQGDSGGGLMVVYGGKYVVWGIVSFGYSCAAPNLPGLYTRVLPYLDWIKQNTNTTTPEEATPSRPNNPPVSWQYYYRPQRTRYGWSTWYRPQYSFW